MPSKDPIASITIRCTPEYRAWVDALPSSDAARRRDLTTVSDVVAAALAAWAGHAGVPKPPRRCNPTGVHRTPRRRRPRPIGY